MSKLSTISGGDETQELVCKCLLRYEPLHKNFTYTLFFLSQSSSCTKFCLNSPRRWFPPITGNKLLLHSHSPIHTMQQSLDPSRSNTTSWYEGYYDGSPFYNRHIRYTGSVYRKIAPNQQLHKQYRAPTSGPKRNRRRKRFRKAGPQVTNQLIHEPSGAVSYGRSIGVNPGISRNAASNNPGRGKV